MWASGAFVTVAAGPTGSRDPARQPVPATPYRDLRELIEGRCRMSEKHSIMIVVFGTRVT